MFLSDIDIKKEVKAGTITIKPFDEKRLQPASYDIRLGNKFIVNEIVVKDGQEFILHPGISILGTSKEFFGSDDFLVQIGGKSSLARIGLMVHNTAGIINHGHFLNITLELSNQNNVPIILRPGMEIAQITFSMMSSPPSRNYKKTGRFAKNNWAHFVAAKKRT
jgi:dCTP deaminase